MLLGGCQAAVSSSDDPVGDAGAPVSSHPAASGSSIDSAAIASDSPSSAASQPSPSASIAGNPSASQAAPTLSSVDTTPSSGASNSGPEPAESIRPTPSAPAAVSSFEPPITPGSGPLGVETTCDGVDDDRNGVIDDVDSAADGVCDCLKVATLGLHGEWGDGDVLTDWLESRTSVQAKTLQVEDLTAEGLAPYQILLIQDVSTNHTPGLSFPKSAVDALQQWVRDGGGLMTVIGYSDAGEASNVNTLIEPFSLTYGSEQVVPGNGAAVPVTEWFPHPITQGVERVGADNGYPAEGQGTTIAAEGGHDLGKAVTIGDGHVLVWGDEWVTYAAEWEGDTTYQVDQFWRNTLRWLTRADECQVPLE